MRILQLFTTFDDFVLFRFCSIEYLGICLVTTLDQISIWLFFPLSVLLFSTKIIRLKFRDAQRKQKMKRKIIFKQFLDYLLLVFALETVSWYAFNYNFIIEQEKREKKENAIEFHISL